MRKRARQRRKTRQGLDPLSWSLFAALVLSLFFVRIAAIWGFVTPRDCYEIDINFIGPTPAFDGPFEWLLLVGLAAIGALAAQAINALVTHTTTRTFWALWTVNLIFAGLLIWAFAMVWAWFNPTAPAARPIFQITGTVQPFQHYVQPDFSDDRKTGPYFDWKWDEKREFLVNEDIGLKERAELITVCDRANLKRAQLKLIYGERHMDGSLIDDMDRERLTQTEIVPVLYDLEGNYLVTLADRNVLNARPIRERDAAYAPEKAAMSPEEAKARWIHHNVWYGFDRSFPARTEFPRIPKEEIDQIVAESWGDDAPSWYEGE